MHEAHVVLLFYGQFPTCTERTVVLEAALRTEEIVASVGTSDWGRVYAKRGIAPPRNALLIDDASIPVVVLPKRLAAHLATFGVFLPTVSCLSKYLKGIVVVQLPLITETGIKGVEKESQR